MRVKEEKETKKRKGKKRIMEEEDRKGMKKRLDKEKVEIE